MFYHLGTSGFTWSHVPPHTIIPSCLPFWNKYCHLLSAVLTCISIGAGSYTWVTVWSSHWQWRVKEFQASQGPFSHHSRSSQVVHMELPCPLCSRCETRGLVHVSWVSSVVKDYPRHVNLCMSKVKELTAIYFHVGMLKLQCGNSNDVSQCADLT